MAAGLNRGAALSAFAVGEPLYDCHSRRFARLDHGAPITSGFVPMFLGRLFGVPARDWRSWINGVRRDLVAMDRDSRMNRVAELLPSSPASAAEVAFFAYPEAEQYLARTADGLWEVRDEHLRQPNVALGGFEHFDRDARKTVPLARGQEEIEAFVEVLFRLATGASVAGPMRDRFGAAGLLAEATPQLQRPPAGLFLIGHSCVLARGEASGVLVDPFLSNPFSAGPESLMASELRPLTDAVLITHGHFDHYHLPSLIAFRDRPVFVPRVPAASLICEDMAARLREFGFLDVRTPAWGERFEVGDLTIEAAPFVGEQFLTSELYPEIRNHGNTWVVEHGGRRAWVAADSGFEPDRSVLDAGRQLRASGGAIDILIAQAAGLCNTFGGGDPDVLLTSLTSPGRAVDAVELLCPENRITLDVEDLPGLCAEIGASTVLLNGQFTWTRGRTGVRPALLAKAQGVLAGKVEVPDPDVGSGIDWSGQPIGPI